MIVTFASMKPAACLLVGNDEHVLAVARDVARRVFPHVNVRDFRNLEDAANESASQGISLLVLATPDSADADKAVKTIDSTGLRRWAVVALETTTATEGAEIVLPEDWTEPVLTRVFEAAVTKHHLIQQNARMHGDLLTLAHRISHDMRTPLGGITTTCELVKELLAEHDPKDASLTAPIFTSVDEVSKLIERVSFVLKASVNPVTKKPVAMSEPVFAALQRLESRMIKKNASVIQPASWPEIPGVERLLETVWWNLLANAIQHGGETPRIELGWSESGGDFRFWIQDHGPGVPGEARARLFQPFHTLHETSSTRGLGLSITQRLVELQGGRCGCESPDDGGSRFFFTIPNT